MLHPSYKEMIEKLNADATTDLEDAPLLTSRYFVVMASSRRARQMIDGAEPKIEDTDEEGRPRKPLSIAVDELYEGKVHLLLNEDEPDRADV